MNPLSISDQERKFALEEIHGFGYFNSIQWLDSVESTNKQLVQWVREQSIPLPALLAADRQLSGIGRGNNQWWSPRGCLMFSMAIPVDQSDATEVDNRFVSSSLLPLRVGCVVAECLHQFSTVKPMVKWPNDVHIAGKKACGVLIEVIPQPFPARSVAIIGIGINCRVDFQNAPDNVRANATSLHEWTRKGASESISTEKVLVQLVHRWQAMDQRQRENPRWLLEGWPEWSLLDGQWVEIKHPAGLAAGRCLGINDSGAIRIQNEQLDVLEVIAGTVQSFRPLS